MKHDNDFIVKTRKASYDIKYVTFDAERAEPGNPHSWKINIIQEGKKTITMLALSGNLKRGYVMGFIDALDNGL